MRRLRLRLALPLILNVLRANTRSLVSFNGGSGVANEVDEGEPPLSELFADAHGSAFDFELLPHEMRAQALTVVEGVFGGIVSAVVS